MPTVVFLVLSFPFYYCYRDCREIITETACTSTRLWHPIMPRGAPRGHGIFYQSAERSGKTASVFCSFFFFWSPTMCLDQRHHCLAVVVTRALKQSRRHSKDTLHLKLPGTQHLTRAHISMSNMYRLLSSFPTNSIRTFRYIECIDILRSLVSDFINCIDTWTMKRCSRWAQQLVLLYKLLIYVWKHLLLKISVLLKCVR